MNIKEDFNTIEKIIEDFFQKTTFDVDVECSLLADETIAVRLKSAEPQVLIGEGGQTLAEMQYILKAVIKRKMNIQDQFFVDLDINDYKKKKVEYLKETVRIVADEVALLQIEKELPPMPAYERRIVHMELAGREDIATESIGEGMERRIAIKPRQ